MSELQRRRKGESKSDDGEEWLGPYLYIGVMPLLVVSVSSLSVPEEKVSVGRDELDGLDPLGVARVLVHALLGQVALVLPVARTQA